MKSRICRPLRRSIRAELLLVALAFTFHSTAATTTPCGNPEPTKDPECGPCEKSNEGGEGKTCPDGESGNDSRSEFGPLMKIPTGASSSPKTRQSFFQSNGSNAIFRARDLRIANSTANLPLEFVRQYQSRVREGMSDDMGHGITWTHSFSYRLWFSSTNKRSILFPDGTIREFTAGGSVAFEGATQIEHLPVAGRGERLYQGGAGENWFTLILPNGSRHVFERVVVAGAGVYHPRYSADAEGRRHTYATDSKARIVNVSDQGGNSLTLTYGAIQIDRKSNILLSEIYGAPTAGWNEITRPTTSSYRWYQVVSSEKNFCNFAEIEFYGKNAAGVEVKLNGTPYGTGPAHIDHPSDTFEKAWDGDETTSFRFARRLFGVTGIDLGAGNETKLTKIRYRPNTGAGAPPLADFKGVRFETVREEPQFVEVLQRVEASDGRAVNYLYETIVDSSIDQAHLVLSGVDYDGDQLATAATDARFTYTFTNEGCGPSVATFYEPRTLGNVPHLKYEYLSAQLDTRGMVSKALNAENNELIAENIPNAERIVRFPGGREIKVDYSSANGREKKITDAYGNETDYVWNPANLFLKSTTDVAGRRTEFNFNSRGQRTSITRADGFKEDTTYDASGRLTGVTESAAGYPARSTSWTRDAGGKCIRKDYPDGSYETYAYNALGLVTEKRERNGSITARTYDPTGLVLTLTLASGTSDEETISFTYYTPGDPTGSPARLVKTETDPRGRTTSYEYNNRGQITRTTFPDGSFRAVAYDAFGNSISESDGVDTRSWTYNNYKQVTSATDPMGHITRYYYGEGGIACGCFNNGGPTMVISPEGRLTLRSYDLEWRLARETVGHNSPEAATTEWLYDPLGNLAIKTSPGGVSHSYGYDERNRPTSESVKGGGLDLLTIRAYDPFGNLISETKPGGRTTTKTYNLLDLPVTVTDALGTITSYQYDSAENPIAVTRDATGPLAVTTSTAYDLLNRPVLVTYPDGTTSATSYHPGGTVHTQTNELGNVITMDDGLITWSDSKGGTWTSFVATTTDALGHTTSSHSAPTGRFAGVRMDVSPLGRVRENHRNACGLTSEVREGLTAAGSSISPDVSITSYTYDGDHLRLSQTVDPGGLNLTTSFGYDARGNRLTVTDPLGRTTTTQYDLRGNAVKTTLPDSRQHLYAYDALDRKTSEIDPKNQVISYTYRHETSQLTGLRDAKNQLTIWTHNALDQILTKSYPNGDTHVYTYDSLHRLKTHRTPKNETCTHSYDLRDRVTLDDWNTTTPDTVREYFANGLLKKIDNGVAKSNYAYSVRNELLSEAQTSNGDTAVVSYTYDADGLRTGMGSPSGSPVDYRWTARRQLADISRDGPPPFATYSYDKAGRNTAIAHENGITELKTYNAAGDLLGNQHTGGSGMGHSYTYDLASRRTSETRTGSAPTSSAFGYDAASQVTSADYGTGQTDTYAYDAMGNRMTANVASLGGTAISYTTNSANQYTGISQNGTGTTPTYDANGNLIAANGVTYTWDSENRLLSVADGNTRIDHSYDGHHRRIGKKVTNLAGNTVSSQIRFVYDGWNVIEEHSPSIAPAPSLLRTYTWGTDLSGTLQGAGGVGGLLLAEEIISGTTTASHYHYDGNGNVTQLTDLGGSSVATYRYDVFGNTIAFGGIQGAINKYRFSTKPSDLEIDSVPLYYYGYRHYGATLGRWTSRDPMEEIDGCNMYRFIRNRPIDLYDKLGLCSLGDIKFWRKDTGISCTIPSPGAGIPPMAGHIYVAQTFECKKLPCIGNQWVPIGGPAKDCGTF